MRQTNLQERQKQNEEQSRKSSNQHNANAAVEAATTTVAVAGIGTALYHQYKKSKEPAYKKFWKKVKEKFK